MTLSFQIKDSDGTILTQGTEEVVDNFSLHDFLNKTIPGWEKTVKSFYDKTEGQFTPRFAAAKQAKQAEPTEVVHTSTGVGTNAGA